MKRSIGALRAWVLAAALITTCNAISVSTHTNTLFARAGSCGIDNYTKCSQSGLPDNFCCPTGQDCILLAGATTVLCCPKGVDCSAIQKIACDVGLQDPSKHPNAQVKTTALKASLPKCGVNCCPFGYSCEDDTCVKNADQSKKPTDTNGGSTSASASASGSGTSKTTASATKGGVSTTTGTGTSSATGTASGSATPSASGTKSGGTSATATAEPAAEDDHAMDANQIGAIAGGVVGGVVGLALLLVGWLWWKRRKGIEERRKRESDRSFVSKNAITISAPMPNQQYQNYGRSDFVSKASTTPSMNQDGGFDPDNPFASPTRTYSLAATERSLEGADDDEDAEGRSYHPSAAVRGLHSRPGSTQSDGQDGFEDINIFADPAEVPPFSVGGNAGDRGSRGSTRSTSTRWTGMQRKGTER